MLLALCLIFSSPSKTPIFPIVDSLLFSFFQDYFLVLSLGLLHAGQVLSQITYKNLRI